MRKIVFYTMAMTKGGTERVISNLANYLSEKNYDVYLICNVNKEVYYELSKKIHYITLDKKRESNIFSKLLNKVSITRTKKLNDVLVKINPDIIIAFLPEPSLRCLQMKRYKTILSERNNPSTEYSNIILRGVMKKLFKKADGFVFQTKDARDYYLKILNCKSRIILNPINENFIGRNYLGEDSKTIVNVGRLCKQKNQKSLIKAFSMFCVEYPEYTLKIYGEGKLKSKLKKYAVKCGVGSKVQFMGICNDLYNKITNDKMFVLSSDYEGMPNALMEAMAVGMPCISTDCPVGGPKTLIKSNENGILVKIKNVDEMCNAMKKIASDKEFAYKLSCNAQKSIKKMKPNLIYKEWEEFILEIINS